MVRLPFAAAAVVATLPFLASAAAASSGGGGSSGFLRKSELPDTGEEWISLSVNEEFQPAPALAAAAGLVGNNLRDGSAQKQGQRQLSFGDYFGRGSYYRDKFVDGNTYYDEYSQAWRVLGWYVDCSASAQDNRRRKQRRRRLEDAYDDEEEEEEEAEEVYDNYDYNDNGEAGCRRYVMWAAYVDLDYEGGGIGEYQFYDPETGEWDETACEVHPSAKSGRCVPMDCHLPNTNFKLLGFYKQYDYDDFMEQLFKHQAYCLWSESQYEFMDGYRESWPDGCTQTEQSVNGGSTYIYTDIKPLQGGEITLGLYTDASCTVPYTGGRVRLQDVVEEYYGNSVAADIEMWNEAFGIFHYCQPCKAYTLSSSNNGDDGGGDEDDPNEGYFQCDDDAGYTNVNQCMKFSSQTDMEVASYPDVTLASRQGTIARTYAADVVPTFWEAWGFFTISAVVFVLGLIAFLWSARPPRVIKSRNASEPLVPRK